MTYQPHQLDPPTAAQAATDGDLMPWREAADLIGVKFNTLARWVDRGKLRYVTIEGRRYIHLADASRLEKATRHRRTTPV